MFEPCFARPTRVTLVTVTLLASFILLNIIANPTTYAGSAAQTQEPAPPPDEDPDPRDAGGVSSLPQAQRAVALPIVGGAWAAQGPGPATNGQVENIPNGEVVGAVHVLAAHPTNADILYAGGANGGIWKTTDATNVSPNWTPLTDDKGSLSIGALEFDPTDATHNTLVAGFGRYSSYYRYGGPRAGLLHTIDGGTTWTEIDGGLAGKNISGVAPRGSSIVVTSNIADSFTCSNIGIFRSINGGVSFSQVGPRGAAFDLASDPSSSAILYAGLTYVNVCSGGANGIYKSIDTGTTWTKVSDAAMDALIIDGTTNNIEIDARSSSIFVNIIQNGQTAGIFYSADGGSTWTAMDLPLLPQGALSAISSVTPGTPITIGTGLPHGLYSGDEAQIANVAGTTGANGIHTITYVNSTSFTLNGSSDGTAYSGGGTWQKLAGMNPREKPGSQGSIHASIRIDPTTPSTVYVGGDRQDYPFPNYIGAVNYSGNLFRGDASVAANGSSPSPQWEHLTHSNSVATIPGGGTNSSSSPHADSREMVFDANGSLIEGDDGGIYRQSSPQDNSGDWFSIIGNMQVTEMHDVAYDNLSDKIISGNQDTGTTYQTSAGGSTWNSISTADGGDVAVDNIVLAGSSQSVRYSSYQNLGYFRRTVWDSSGNLISHTFPSLTVSGGGAAFAAKFVTPVVTNNTIGNRLLIGGSNSLYESFDGGTTISEIGPGLVVNTGGHTLDYGTAANADAFYAATGNSQVSVRTAAAGPINSYAVASAGDVVRGVAMDPANHLIGYAIDSDQVFMTNNAGTSWIDITGGGGSGLTDNNLRSIVAAPGMLFVGGGFGVYMMETTVPGSWVQLGTGLPHAPVWDLDYDVTDEVLVAGTLGRGAWLLPFADSHDIDLNVGWNMISSYISPDPDDMAQIFPPAGGDFLLCKDINGLIFWPDLGIDDLANWDPMQGYQCYGSNSFSITITGSVIPAGSPLTVLQGWNMIAYWRDTPLTAESALASCSGELTLAKNGVGEVFWPEYNVNQVGNMQPGQGYLMYVDPFCTLIYPTS